MSLRETSVLAMGIHHALGTESAFGKGDTNSIRNTLVQIQDYYTFQCFTAYTSFPLQRNIIVNYRKQSKLQLTTENTHTFASLFL